MARAAPNGPRPYCRIQSPPAHNARHGLPLAACRASGQWDVISGGQHADVMAMPRLPVHIRHVPSTQSGPAKAMHGSQQRRRAQATQSPKTAQRPASATPPAVRHPRAVRCSGQLVGEPRAT
jgi:hypothetical protein